MAETHEDKYRIVGLHFIVLVLIITYIARPSHDLQGIILYVLGHLTASQGGRTK